MGKNTLQWLGHSTFLVNTARGTKILIDPWITGNPACPVEKEDLSALDIILITHDHGDHMGEDVPFFASTGDPEILVQPEVLAKLSADGVEGGTGMNIGGTATARGVEVTMVQAHHSSGVGSPCGYIITTEDGKKVYHAGDTGIFATMGTLGDLYELDVALLPTGSHFVMDDRQAAHAVELLRPKTAIPMHFGTFPVLTETADEFVRLVEQGGSGAKTKVLRPGDEMEF